MILNQAQDDCQTSHFYADEGRGREDAQHDGEGGPSRSTERPTATGVNKDSERAVNRENIDLTNYHCI